MATASKNKKTNFQLIFPEHGEPGFGDRLTQAPEYQLFRKDQIPEITSQEDFEEYVQAACSGFEKTLYQHFVQNYLSRRSPYKSLLLFHGLGSGKTCSAITIAESLLLDHNAKEPPRILVISPSALQASFEDQIFSYARFIDYGEEALKNQCTEDTYRKLIYGTKDRINIKKRIQNLIHSRYQFITYEGLVTYMKNRNGEPVRDKVIIVDEAHNLRQNDVEKAAADALIKLVETGERNRLVLLSATPMYNEPNEIFWLLSLLIKNDKRSDILANLSAQKLFKINSIQDTAAFELLKVLANEYISYVKGSNPFTFPARLSPTVNGTPVLQEAWAKDISDGLVISALGSEQKGVIHDTAAANTGKVIKNSPVLLQLTNITYPTNGHGEEGFKKIFRRLESDFLQVEYIPGKENTLLPTPDKLGRIASKIQRICDIIRNSEGIVVIYSQFVWAGVIPCAIALEHMGFQRYISQSTVQQLLHIPQNTAAAGQNVPRVKYTGIQNPNYCILSGDASVMGNSKIHEILNKVNNINNMNGQKIKVVLMTPIASEGLNFKNVREIHILDPWYHMNKLEQVIGRTIRTCSHSALPLDKRNVTTYLHVTATAAKETADIHAYKISARKLFEMKKAEQIIRDSALDCSLMINTNYYPKALFQFPIQMKTSQNKLINYSYGDSIDMKPQCTSANMSDADAESENTSEKAKDILIPTDVYENILPSIISKIKNYLQKDVVNKSQNYVAIDDIIKVLNINKKITLTAIQNILYPNVIIPKISIYPYREGIILKPEQSDLTHTEIKLPTISELPSPEQNTCDIDRLLSPQNIPTNADFFVATYKLYSDLDSQCWPQLAKRCIETRTPIIDRFAGYLAKTGALISKAELPKIIYEGKYVGYVNIFNTTQLQITLYDPKTKAYRDPTDLEMRQITAGRTEFEKSTQKTYGMLMPRKNKKNPNEPMRNELKIVSPGPNAGKGAECSTKKWNEIRELLDIFEIKLKKDENVIKSSICFTLGVEMFRKGALLLYPEWKPKSI
jgi:superfamily II DNA or RNA helicase